MENNDNWCIGRIYPKWYYLAITFVGLSITIGFIFGVMYDFRGGIVELFVQALTGMVIIGGGCTTISVFTWQKYPWEKVPMKHLVIEITLISTLILVYICTFNLIYGSIHHTNFRVGIESNKINIVITILITFLIATIHEAILFYQQWKLNFSKSIQLEKDNLEVSYNALKSQVNPHFLFNSLNSLMCLLENNHQAEQYVQDLSDFLRYVLLSNEREAVSLAEELGYLEKYNYLQKLRFKDNLKIEISIDKVALQMTIPPLTLQMLVDNCIKHNTISEKHPLHIRVFNNGKSITVVNNLQRKQVGETTGQGLKNIEGRYRFVTGESVKIDISDSEFRVTIPLLAN